MASKRQRLFSERRTLLVVAALVATAASALLIRLSFPTAGIVGRVGELQKKINQASMKFGGSFYTVVGSEGETKLQGAMAPGLAFGDRILLEDLHALLEARANAGWLGLSPMSGDVDRLCEVVFGILAQAGEMESISYIEPLLRDNREEIKAWAAITLFRMGERNPALRERISQIKFPASAVEGASNRACHKPEWL